MAPAIPDSACRKGRASATDLDHGVPGFARRACCVTRVGLVSVLAVALAACGSGAETLEAVQNEAAAAAKESGVVDALDPAIDEQALEGLARGAIHGAVNEAIGEVVPAEEMAAVRAVVDEEAIARSLGAQLDGAAKAEPGGDNPAR